MDKNIITDASIPGNGFRLADKYYPDHKEWHRTCLDFLKIGDIFRFVTQKGVTDGKSFLVIEPLEMVKVHDKLTDEYRLAYHGGKMKFEEVNSVVS